MTAADKTAEVFGVLLLLAMWWYVATHYVDLPDMVPMHYDASGEPDRFGDKVTLLMLPIVATITFFGLTLLNKFPHVFNYLVPITAENTQRQYTNATRMIRYMKLSIVIVFGHIAYETIQIALGRADGLSMWPLPVTLVLIFAPLVYFISASVRMR